MSVGEKQRIYCFPLLGNDSHPQCLTSLLHKKIEEAFTPLKVKAVLTLPYRKEDVVAEVALWEHLNTAWSGTCWVGVFVDHSHMKATCGSGVEDCGGGSLVCFLCR